MNYTYNYITGNPNYLDYPKLNKSLSLLSNASNSQQWADAWVSILQKYSVQQETYLEQSKNREYINHYFKKNDSEFINISWRLDYQEIHGFINVSETISNFRSQKLPTYKFPTSFLTDPQRFRWQPTSDIHIKLDNIGQPIIAFPLVKNTTYMILDGNHRATKALKESQPFLNGIFINREEFFRNLIFFPSNFDFYASFLAIVLNELSFLELLNRKVDTIPQSFFPPKLPYSSYSKDKRTSDVFRLYN